MSEAQFSATDQVLIGQAMEAGAIEAKAAKIKERQERRMRFLENSIRQLTANGIQLQDRMAALEKAAEIETVCAWCKTHLSGPEGVAPERVSHGICPQCLEREFPEKVKEAVAAQRREYGDTPFTRILTVALELARRELEIVAGDIERWADADAARYEYPYGRKE